MATEHITRVQSSEKKEGLKMVPKTEVGEDKTVSHHCQYSRGPKQHCQLYAMDGQKYCLNHTCPSCMRSKPSTQKKCGACGGENAKPKALTLPPPPGTPETCQYSGPRGKCTLRRRIETYYCTAHACPVCKQAKDMDAKRCPAHSSCVAHAWEDASVADGVGKCCTVCRSVMTGFSAVKCGVCGECAHWKCASKAVV